MRAKYGVSPRQLIEVKALMGDASDNIPGVAGIGEKTALALIAEFGTLAGVYEHLDSDKIRPAVRAKLERGKEQAEMSRYLAEIVTDAPIETAPAGYVKGKGDPAAAARLLASLEMQGLLDKLGLSPAPAAAPAEGKQEPLPRLEPRPLALPLPAPAAIARRTGAEAEEYLVVSGGALYTAGAEDPAFLQLLADGGVKKRVFDAKPLHELAQRQGRRAEGIAFDGKLAAYLLNPRRRAMTRCGSRRSTASGPPLRPRTPPPGCWSRSLTPSPPPSTRRG